MADSFLEKKHAATPRRRQQARQQGQVAVSQDLTSAALLLAAVAAIWFFGSTLASHLAVSVSHSLTAPVVSDFDISTAASWFVQLAAKLVVAVVPILIIVMLAGVMTNLIQTGLIVTPLRVAPKLSNINPQAGLKRVFSISGTARFGFGLIKISAIMLVAYVAIRHYGLAMLSLDSMDAPKIAGVLFQSLVGTCLWIGSTLFALALLDYGFQRWKLEQDLMMTDEELRQEMKETAGDPQIIDRRREISRKFASGPSDMNLTSADLVLVDDDGWSVAIRYDSATMRAPVVTAFGSRDNTRIRSAAMRQSIPIRQQKLPSIDRQLVVIGQPIPAALYPAAAAVLAANSS